VYLPRLSIGKPILSGLEEWVFCFLNREYGSQNIICLKPSPMICRETTIEEKYLETFKYVPHQRSLYVIINGETVGFDVLSLEKVYQALLI